MRILTVLAARGLIGSVALVVMLLRHRGQRYPAPARPGRARRPGARQRADAVLAGRAASLSAEDPPSRCVAFGLGLGGLGLLINVASGEPRPLPRCLDVGLLPTGTAC